ncbi:unnamed protein product [Camellia sinensis]
MEHLIPLVITNLSATELKDGRLFGRMKVYASVSISGGPPTGYNSVFRTHVDMEGNNNPRWNTVMDFRLHGPSLRNNLLLLNFNLYCRDTLDERFIGGVRVPINPLLAMISGNRTASQPVRYPVTTSSGDVHGFINFCFGYGNSIRPSGSQQPAPQSRQPRPPHVAREAQQPAPQRHPPPPPQAYQYDYGDQANQYDYDDQANQYDYDYDDQANAFDDVSDYY